MLISHNWLKKYTEDNTKTIQEIADLLGEHAFEIEGIEQKEQDAVIDVDVLPNRASDSLCHRGIARELATLTDKPLVNDPLSLEPELVEFDDIEIEIENEEACPRFTASLITGIEIKESPDWLKEKLEVIGQRSINNVVDATNYVMYSIGQPIHAYDADLFPQVENKWKIKVRYAKEGEVVSLIAEGGKNEERDIELKGTELLVVDNSSNTPIGLAGVKGGRFAGIHDGTTKIIVEAAHFHPTITRKTARRLGIVIDASKRFENEPSRELPVYAQSEIVKLILEIAGGKYIGTVDEYLIPYTSTTVKVSVKSTNALLGISLSKEEMVDILKRVGCDVSLSGDIMTVMGPFERTDLNIEEDFIEEIGRIYGYEHILSIAPKEVLVKKVNKKHYYSEMIREKLIGLGFSEIITSSFRKKDKLQLKNALASDKSYLRSSLAKNIKEALDKNASFVDLLGTIDTKLFEIGTVFYFKDDVVAEHVALSLGVRLKASGYSGKEDKILDSIIDELNKDIGTKIDFEIYEGVAECNISKLLEVLPEKSEYKKVEMGEEIDYKPFSQYPSMSRDIAMWVEKDVTADEVKDILNGSAGELRVRTTFIDEFSKEGRTSFAFRLVFQADDRTLTDEEINEVMGKIYLAVEKKDWEVR